MAALTLLLLGACVTAPANIIKLPPSAHTALQTTPPAISIPEEIQTSALPLTAPVATTPLSMAAEPPFNAATATEPAPVTTAAQPDYYQSFASYYAKRFEGRRTASGERYDPAQMTAATRDFPLQSWLKVLNPANGREVIVRVNDRTGKRKTPLIDLSRAAAKELDFLGRGKIRVHIIPVLPAR